MDNAQLDALVAEKVMGWTVEGADYPYYAHYRTPDDVFVPNPVQPSDALRVRNWYPSENIAQAWQVVERMVAQGYAFTLDWRDGMLVLASFDRSGDADTLAEAGTAPLAICLAALQAVGVEID